MLCVPANRHCMPCLSACRSTHHIVGLMAKGSNYNHFRVEIDHFASQMTMYAISVYHHVANQNVRITCVITLQLV